MADAPDDGEVLTELLGWIPEDIRNRVGEYLAREALEAEFDKMVDEGVIIRYSREPNFKKDTE